MIPKNRREALTVYLGVESFLDYPEPEVHTPFSHVHHTKDCGCSTSRDTDQVICLCGAAYTIDALSFPVFRCYDCGEVAYINPLVSIQKRRVVWKGSKRC